MVKVTCGTTLKRNTVIVDENTTLRSVLDNAEVDYSRWAVNLDGSALKPGDLNKTFAQFGITENCYLLAVEKADNANA